MKIGISRNDYPEKRCILGGDGNEFYNLKYSDPYLYFKRFLKSNRGSYFTPILADAYIDAIFVFNDVVRTKKPWVSIFESVIPRYHSILGFNELSWPDRVEKKSELITRRLELIAKDNCKCLFSISHCTYDLQSKFLDFYPEYKKVILDKTVILPPPQKAFKTNCVGDNSQKIKFCFVGRDFYRKGGAETVLAFQYLIENDLINPNHVELTIVGNLSKHENYIFDMVGMDDIAFFDKIESIIMSSNYINHIPEASNNLVMEVISSSDVGLLPTWADTYGYSVLEMQAFNIPVITTNVRALEEINYSKLIVNSSFKNDRNEIMLTTLEQKYAARDEIISGISHNILLVMDSLNTSDSAFSVVKSIEKYHNPNVYFDKLYGVVS